MAAPVSSVVSVLQPGTYGVFEVIVIIVYNPRCCGI